MADQRRQGTRRSRRIAKYLDIEASVEGERGSDDEEEEEEPTCSVGSFITDASQSQDSPGDHLAINSELDRQQEEEEEKRRQQEEKERHQQVEEEEDKHQQEAEAGPSGSGDDAHVEPYFPLGLAAPGQGPTSFNFNLFLFDTLRLTRGLLPTDCEEPLEFESVFECSRYCDQFVEFIKGRVRTSREKPDKRLTNYINQGLSKEALFQCSGLPLESKLATGNEVFDRNLKQLRLDVFGNVMALFAHSWSDISVQYTHGYPSRLVPQAHRGCLPGNITAAALVSNRAIRSLAPGDVAGFLSANMIKNLGLTPAELMLARSSALRYAGRQNKPARLVEFMFRYGIDFLHLMALTTEQLQTLTETTTSHLSNVFVAEQSSESSSSANSSESEEDLPKLTVSWVAPSEECGNLPPPEHERHTPTIQYHLSRLVQGYLHPVEAEAEAPAASLGPTQDTTARKSSSGQRKHKRKSRAAAVEKNQDQSTEAPALAPVPDQPGQKRNPRECLLALPGLLAHRVPNLESLAKLSEFLQQTDPIMPGVHLLENTPVSQRKVLYETAYEGTRLTAVEQAIQTVWETCKKNCLCLGHPICVASSQGSQDDNCPYCRLDEESRGVYSATSPCPNPNCVVCSLINKLDSVPMTTLGVTKNDRFTTMLYLSEHIACQLNSQDLSEEARKDLMLALCTLLCCGMTRLRNIANVGFLVQICPNLRYLRLNRRWGDFWGNLSKVGTAVGFQTNRKNQVSTLVYLRHSCLPDRNNSWHHYLRTAESAFEEEVLSTVFADCFAQTEKGRSQQNPQVGAD